MHIYVNNSCESVYFISEGSRIVCCHQNDHSLCESCVAASLLNMSPLLGERAVNLSVSPCVYLCRFELMVTEPQCHTCHPSSASCILLFFFRLSIKWSVLRYVFVLL